MPTKVYSLPYGKESIKIEFDEQNFFLLLPSSSPPPLSYGQISEAISNPIGSPDLSHLLHSDDKILVVASDITRTTALDQFLPILIEEIRKADVSSSNIKIIFALGDHRSLTSDEIIKILGQEIAKCFEIVQHNSQESTSLAYIGKTSRGTEVYLNKILLQADKVILTGAINYHYFAGFTGGRKSLIPGLSGLSTIVNNHKLCLDFDAKKIMKGIAPGELKNNPLNLDLEEATSLIPPTFIVNSILNEDGKITGLFSGHWLESHHKGCSFYHKFSSMPIKEKKGVAIVSCGGYPKDINLIQSHKTLQYSSRCLKDNGNLILLAECSDGIGSPDFLNWFPIENIDKFFKRFKNSLDTNGQAAFFLHTLASHFRIILVSSLEPDIVSLMGMQPASNIEEAFSIIEKSVLEKGGYIIPKGGSTLPILFD